MARTWRVEAVRGRNSGPITSWRLLAGRAETRIRLNLGSVSRDEAERCAVAMNEEEQRYEGTPMYDRFLRSPAIDTPEKLVGALLDPDRHLKAGAPPPSRLTVSEYFDEHFWPARSDPSGRFGVAPATAKAEAGYWRNKSKGCGILDSEIGSARLEELTDQHWVRFEDAQSHLSGRSMALRRAAYAALLAFARRSGHIDFKPEFFRIKGATKRTKEQSDPLSLEEVLKLMAAAQADPSRALGAMRRALWAVGAGLGLRPGELVRLEWSDVDWEARTLLVRGTKTEESADTIPMTPLAFRELRELWVREGQPSSGRAFLYHGKAFSKFYKALRRDARAAGITRPVTPYLLRHSFATIAWALGVEKDVARRILRHTDVMMLDKVYCRPRPADLVARVAAFDVPGAG
jgi:integrase